MSATTSGRTLKRADPSTIQDKYLFGYQGWFTCPGDGPPLDPHHHGWLHWFNYPIPDGGRPNTDLWPDVSDYSPSELFPAPGLKYASGEQAFLFSSRNARTVQRHLHWMAEHGLDGVFLQRFLGQCDLEGGNEAIRSQRDEVGDLIRDAAEKDGRVFAIMYDLAGVAPDRIQHIFEKDWVHLIRDKRLLDSPNYLREKGKPVITIWGFGMSGSGHDPATIRACTSFIRNNTPGGAYIIGGTPAYWRTSDNDADPNPEFLNVWLEEFDAISPWTIGRFGSPEDADRYAERVVKGDLELIRKRNEEAEGGMPNRRHIDFLPVIFPGGSGFNLSEGKWGWNDIPRRGGQFLWRQLWNMRRLGIRTFYGAMWDEYDEGTAYLPVVSHKRQLPVHEKYNFMALDEDGFDLPPDWYMRVAGYAAEGLRSERLIHESFPSKEIQDYWSSRPRYEDSGESSKTSSEKPQAWEDWEKNQKLKESENEAPPPPYTLTEEELNALPVPPKDPPRGPEPVTVAEPVVGALNAIQDRPLQPPPTSLSSRPSVSRPSGSTAGPPPIPTTSRPTTSRPASSVGTASPSLSVSSLADDLGRQRLSSASPQRLEAGPSHSRPSSTRPISPYRRDSIPETCPSPVFPAYQPTAYGQPSYEPPVGNSPFPTPGYPIVTSPEQAKPGGWSSAPWPPPEWGTTPSPAPQAPQSWSSYPDSAPYATQYNTPYGPPPSSPPPSLRPRPSMSSRPEHRPVPGPPSPSSPSYYGAQNQDVGGFAFPQAQVSPAQSYSYAPQPQPQQVPQPYGAYGPSAYPAPSPPPSTQYGFPGAPSSYPHSNPAGGSYSSGFPPPPPPQHPGGTNPGYSASASRPGSGSSMFPSGASSMLSSGKIQSLAQSGLSTGTKLFNKFKR